MLCDALRMCFREGARRVTEMLEPTLLSSRIPTCVEDPQAFSCRIAEPKGHLMNEVLGGSWKSLALSCLSRWQYRKLIRWRARQSQISASSLVQQVTSLGSAVLAKEVGTGYMPESTTTEQGTQAEMGLELAALLQPGWLTPATSPCKLPGSLGGSSSTRARRVVDFNDVIN